MAAGLLLALAAIVGVVAGDGDGPAAPTVVPTPPSADGEAVVDPFAWHPDRAAELERRAAAGNSHPLYALSPEGAVVSAKRTARWRPLVDRAAADAGVDADTLEGLILLESAGRDDARAPGGLDGAVGLTQILAETGENLLGMRVDLEASERYTARLDRAERRGQERRAEALRRALRRVDERFDPERALAGTARYLRLARERFGREDLAFVSYHMGIGNLEAVLREYSGRSNGEIGDVVEEEGLSYARVYFDSTPANRPAAQRRLAALGDDSSNYLWKLGAAREIMRLWRDDRAELERRAGLHAAGAAGETVLHPPGETPEFGDPEALQRAWDADELAALPDAPETTGLRPDPRVTAVRYRGLRPPALALALYLGAQVRAFSGDGPLVLGTTVTDVTARRHHGLHATGWEFDVRRRYRSRRQALAFQFALDRLRTVGVIAWVRERGLIHVTVSRDAEVLLPLLERVDGG